MLELKRSLTLEQPRINDVLARYTAELPPGARPVAEHVFRSGGKRLRPLLTLLTGRALGCRDEGLYVLGAAIEMLHAATLLHDDILDNAELRRGKPAAHTVFGATQAILAGDAMLSKALLMVAAFGDARLNDSVSLAVMHTAEGEISEFDSLRDADLSHENYLRVIIGKTAWMLRASCELGAFLAGASPELCRAAAGFGHELGIAFQIVDDALDYAPSADTGKPSGGDLKEGKMTPPLLLYLASLPQDRREDLKNRFASGDFSSQELAGISNAIYEQGFASKAKDIAERHLAKAESSLALFPFSKEQVVLRQMLSYIKSRTH